MPGARGALAFVIALFVGSTALSDAFCGSPAVVSTPTISGARRQPRQFARRPGSHDVEVVMLSGEAVAIGVAIVGATTIAASRGLSTLARAFRLADYRTTSGHDLRLDDERLQSKRRRVVQASELSPPRPSAPSSGNKDNTPRVSDLKSDKGAPSLSGSEADMMDWRERIRQASQLPDDAGAGIESAVLGAEEVREEEARYGAVTDDGGGAGLP